MNSYFANRFAPKILIALTLMLLSSVAMAQSTDAKMNAFVSKLMGKMTLDEKIGQLNLVVAGGAVTGSTVNSGVSEKLKKGDIGGQ